jgi:hypothetical protein
MQKAVALAFSVVHLLSVGRGFVDSTVLGREARRRQKAEPVVPLQRLFTDTKPAKRGGNCLKDLLN